MKVFRELYFRGSPQQLKQFLCDIKNYTTCEWSFSKVEKPSSSWIYFDYLGTSVDNARVCIPCGEYVTEGQLKITNIVPLKKNQLNIDEYNSVLIKFYQDVIMPYKKNNFEIEIHQPSDDIFDPKTVITDDALRKLEAFCYGANKSTGSTHPNDQERWFDFICQTVNDDRVFDSSTLAKFLQDETYWGKKDPEMGLYAWDEEHAYQLADEYENACMLLKYYIRTRSDRG